MTDHPTVQVSSLVHYREDAPWLLAEHLAAVRQLEWPMDKLSYWYAHHDNGRPGFVKVRHDLFDVAIEFETFKIPCKPDRRDFRRRDGEVREIMALGYNRILRHFERSGAELLLFVSSDVIVAPHCLEALYRESLSLGMHYGKATVTAQLDNRIADEHDPASNGMHVDSETGHVSRAEYATDCSLVEVDATWACTLVPRSALIRRFHWQPNRNETDECIEWCLDLKALGFRHYLARDPGLAEHRMVRHNMRDQLRRGRQ